MVFLLFAVAAILTVLAAIKLSTYADIISEKSSLGSLFIGTVLIAGATSLPEVTTTASAIFIGNPDIAVGNVLGSNVFNLLILAGLDLYFRRHQIYKHADLNHRFTLSLAMLISLLVVIAIIIKVPYTVLGIGLDMLIIASLYGLGMWYISKKASATPHEPTLESAHEPALETDVLRTEETVEQLKTITNSHEKFDEAVSATIDADMRATIAQDHNGATISLSLKQASWRFALMAIVILGSGTLLTISGDKIAMITGLSSSFIGSFLIAASTSLPEVVACFVAFQLRNYNMAIGSILGSNLFNLLILFGSDILYQPHALLASVSSAHIVTASLTIILGSFVMYALFRNDSFNKRTYVIPSALLVVVYIVSSYLFFIYF